MIGDFSGGFHAAKSFIKMDDTRFNKIYFLFGVKHIVVFVSQTSIALAFHF
jgi:hypothetical protein